MKGSNHVAAFESRTRCGAGIVWTLAGDRALAQAAEELVLAPIRHRPRDTASLERRAEFTQVAGREAYLKGSSLKTRSALRHGLVRSLTRREPPRLREFTNLVWLRERDFEAPSPLAATALLRRGLPRYQALLTERIQGSRTLEEFLEVERDRASRARVLAELAAEVARMHSVAFVHHDLFARNLLVREEGAHGRRVVFLDAWAGGPGGGPRGFAYDLACFFLEASELLEEDEQVAFLESYFLHRERHARPARRASLLASVRRKRAQLRSRLQREPKRLRGREMPRAECAAIGVAPHTP